MTWLVGMLSIILKGGELDTGQDTYPTDSLVRACVGGN